MKDFEKAAYFQGCMPIEVIAERGRESLRFGPMRPVGLKDPRTGRRPWAVVQLRQETRDGTLFGLVGFQTQLRYGGQKDVFRMIPGLQNAEFARLGSLHRNTFLDSPRHLETDLSWRKHPGVWFAGQMTGCEGYVESLSVGLMAARSIEDRLRGRDFEPPPSTTILGALLAYLRDTTVARLTPMNVNFGLVPPLAERVRDKRLRKEAYARRAAEHMEAWVRDRGETPGTITADLPGAVRP
jgi:methylenetetrahydrofolate--tRNA-(uracil-5-)-methyltransferase